MRLTELAGQEKLRKRQVACMKALVDGRGAERIADFLICGNLNECDDIHK